MHGHRCSPSWDSRCCCANFELPSFGGVQIGAAGFLYGMGEATHCRKSVFGSSMKRTMSYSQQRLSCRTWSRWWVRSSWKLSPVTGYYLGTNSLNSATFVKIMNGSEAYGLEPEMLKFGALIAFMGVNAAAFLRYYVRAEKTGKNSVSCSSRSSAELVNLSSAL